jgi:hypothetical protein
VTILHSIENILIFTENCEHSGILQKILGITVLEAKELITDEDSCNLLFHSL